jgi:hypothetical protein
MSRVNGLLPGIRSIYTRHPVAGLTQIDKGETMKKRLTGAIVLQACLFLAAAAAAQAEDKPKDSYLYVTYFYCDGSQQERADQIFDQLDKPFFEAAVANGTTTSYGWIAHHTGGKWRRALYYGAPSIQGLMDAQQKIFDQADAKNKKMSDEFGKICNSHDDYIWKAVAGNALNTTRGNAAFSTYYVCDSTREKQADALIKQVFAPIYDKLIAEGKLKTWGWMEHIVGAEYRRLATLSGADMKTLMEARASISQAMMDNPLGDTFTDICNSHSDYLWEIKSSKP